MELVSRLQIEDETAYISLCANAPGKGMGK